MLQLRPRETSLYNFLDNKLSRFFRETSPNLLTQRWIPAADIRETDDDLCLKMDLPGFEKDDVDIKVEDRRLVISAQRKLERERENGDYHLMERQYGEFQRSFQLPKSAHLDAIDAKLENGMLTITVPKKEEAKKHQIEVKV